MTCIITYSGNWAPVMRWFNSVTRDNFTDDVIISTANDTITSQLTVTAYSILNSTEIVCVTSFDQPSTSLPSNAAANVPNYTYTWTSPMLNVALRCKSNFMDCLAFFSNNYLALSVTVSVYVEVTWPDVCRVTYSGPQTTDQLSLPISLNAAPQLPPAVQR